MAWKPRKAEPYTCKDGSVVMIMRPGPEFTIRAGRMHKTYVKRKETEVDPDNPLAGMSDEEAETLVNYARQLLVEILVEPKLKLNPAEGELGPDDTGADFWPLFNYAMDNFQNAKVPVGNGEVEAKDLDTFRADDSVSGSGMDGIHVPLTEPERTATDPGLVHGTGA